MYLHSFKKTVKSFRKADVHSKQVQSQCVPLRTVTQQQQNTRVLRDIRIRTEQRIPLPFKTELAMARKRINQHDETHCECSLRFT